MEAFFCQNCGENPANLWVTKIMDGNVSKHHLCDECFRKLSGYSLPFTVALPMDMISPFPGMSENIFSSKQARLKVCKNCSASWSDFIQNGYLGCPICYESFSNFLDPIIQDIHSSKTYRGKIPQRLPEDVKLKASLNQLKQKLFSSIDNENYEEAAKIRDKMNNLKEQLDAK